MVDANTRPAASAKGIVKHFGATAALAGVDFDVMPGEVHALVGENGAGKSTLIRIFAGVHRPDRGTIEVEGRPCQFDGPQAAIAAGIVTIPQELRLVPALGVAENISVGDPPVRRFLGVIPRIDRARMREDARQTLAQLDFAPDLDAPAGSLSFAERQLVMIAKALRRRCRILILDEPTAALEKREIDRLFAVLARMKEQGVAIIYISHRLGEVVALADRCTILRDGRVAAVAQRGAFDAARLARAMTGGFEERASSSGVVQPGTTVLQEPAERPGAICLRAQETLGLAGLLGSGTDRVLARLFGVQPEPGTVAINGVPRRLANPRAAIAAGIGMVPAERSLGLIMNASVRDNIVLPSLGRFIHRGRFDKAGAARAVNELMDVLDIRPRRADTKVSALSGGNQQKVVLAKWLARGVSLLLLDEPTQGIDVAAKAQIHALLRDFARQGSILMNSSDLAELVLMCDAVLAFHHGHVAARIERSDLDESRLHAAIGG
ncbi:MAG: sugar ABC transporter ATP-binding protein [Bradyrhizobiaceae bacterium]|nr:sugar ABC transporter ATP-binding protein [Hyphomicrobiales bacterium]MBV9428377.1 sugar ABC transporter ATP-binding protein [Bradyrhizobiaceae bacterium]